MDDNLENVMVLYREWRAV